MFSGEDLSTLHDFLKSTSENNLKNMLVGGKMTEGHLKILMKVMRGTTQAEFISCFEAGTFPRVKLAAPELAMREGFWITCADAFTRVGLLTNKKAA